MQKKFTLLLASLILASTLPQIAYGFKNPLKEYNLYAETHNENVKYDNAMSELYYNQDGKQPQNAQEQAPADNPAPPQENITNEEGVEIEIEIPKRRNVYLRESSMKVYSKGEGNWTNKRRDGAIKEGTVQRIVTSTIKEFFSKEQKNSTYNRKE